MVMMKMTKTNRIALKQDIYYCVLVDLVQVGEKERERGHLHLRNSLNKLPKHKTNNQLDKTSIFVVMAKMTIVTWPFLLYSL